MFRNDINQYIDDALENKTIHEDWNGESNENMSRTKQEEHHDLVVMNYQRVGNDGRMITYSFSLFLVNRLVVLTLVKRREFLFFISIISIPFSVQNRFIYE